MEVIWKDIPGFEGLYQASINGEIRSLVVTNQHGVFARERIVKPHDNGNGYLRLSLYKNKTEKWFYVHRLVALTYLVKKENANIVNHLDHNTYNNAPINLAWCTQKENVNYSLDNGRNKQCIKIAVTSKFDNDKKFFRSMRSASLFLNKSDNYIQVALKNNKHDNKEFSWEVIK